MPRRGNTRVAELLRGLNEEQRAAVEAPIGPVLVLAGAGSGKTRVITHRIAYLIARYGVRPWNILAVTFTNKAAKEMKSRLEALLGQDVQPLNVGTFHSIFARLLRKEAYRFGYSQNFVIYDSDDQLQVVKKILNRLSLGQNSYPPQMVHALISRAKNNLVTPEQYKAQARDEFEANIARVYQEYNGFLKSSDAMDFDDLITLPVYLFREYPDVLEKYQNYFQHILIDEFQDTNVAQNELVLLLGSRHRSVFVVGDDDQSIYRWRGAEVRNILEFENAFPECQVFRLEKNYRSTRLILDAAHSVVKNNRHRKEKKLWTDREGGEPLTLIEAFDETDEAQQVVYLIQQEIKKHKRNFRDFVILYRTNAQSRAIEDALRRNGISYVIVGGIRFYERKEIKDFLAYLRVIANPLDEVSLLRIINVPPRGVGPATIRKLQEYASQKQTGLVEAMAAADEIPGIQSATRNNLKDLAGLLKKYRSLRDKIGLNELVRVLNEELGLSRMYRNEGTLESLSRAENIEELLAAIAEFCRNHEEATLESFLQEVALVTDIDNWNDTSNAVTLMTLHSAKGLEFPVVFITGMEEGLFPLSRSYQDPMDFEEERRLFYVGLTRAKEKVYLSWAQTRRRYADGFNNTLSTFVREIDERYIEPWSRESGYSTMRRRRPVRQKEEVEFEPMPEYENESQEKQLYIGCYVRHQVFGRGVVTEISGQGTGAKVKVLFEDGSEKKLVLEYARLEIL